MVFDKNPLDIKYARSLEEALYFCSRGYEPVECSFGDISVTGKYLLDHHGSYSKQPPVSKQAHSIVATDINFTPLSRFVVTGKPDADVIYALLVLSGQITPHHALTNAISQLDSDPVGVDQKKGPYLRVGPAFRMQELTSDLRGYRRALDIGRSLFSEQLSLELQLRAKTYERQRERCAQEAIVQEKNGVALAHSDYDSTDLWLSSLFFCPTDFVVQYKPRSYVVTVAGKTSEAVRRLKKIHSGGRPTTAYFGTEGLLAFCKTLDEVLSFHTTVDRPGSGGRPTIIGSPRGYKTSQAEALKIYFALSKHCLSFNNPLSPDRAA